ncbi:MAG TPA: DUF2735 domain-containing protein [Bradyrhizobium sp.]|jgi:hypothetical protein|nr:DUF2735 domain-containing protein [Bradyrhizobium sp.]
MTTSIPRGSARIYEFPLRGRFAQGVRDESQRTNLEAQAAVRAVAGSGWYHDAAIAEEAERSRNN